MNALSAFRNVHFVGIGGIGTSALAQWFLKNGASVTGSNLSDEPILKVLRAKGARIFTGAHRAQHVSKDTQLIIHTLAVNAENPELVAAERMGIPRISYPKAVGELTKEKFAIAICGAHGKSTTTALTALTLVNADFDPTVILGTTLKEFGGTNFRYGRSKYLVLEADEWGGAFWNYHPSVTILTTMDREHLDFYRNSRGIERGFKKFLGNMPPDGIIIANGDDKWVRRTVEAMPHRRIFYTLRVPDASGIGRIMRIPGTHNISNAMAVLALSRVLGIPRSVVFRTLSTYRGAWRRFEYKGTLNGAKLYDDYGHHPTEIKATLRAGRAMIRGRGRLWCVFQPHQYLRLKALFHDFASAFYEADRVLILPVYAVAGREGDHAAANTVSAEKLASNIKKNGVACDFSRSFRDTASILKRELKRQDICLLMGAGDIVKIHEFLHNK